MARKFDEVTNQVAVIRSSTRTLSFYANIEPAPKESFMELIIGKIKVSLYDFSKGKGDRGIWVTYNLDLPDVKYLHKRALFSSLPEPFTGSKIIGKAPETQGQFRGLCPSYKIAISRYTVNSKGEKMNNPWQISIRNGYGRAFPGKIKGTFYEGKNTFVQTGEVNMRLSDKDFLDIFDKIVSYLDIYKQIVGYAMVPKYLKVLKEQENKGYTDNLRNVQNSVQSGQPTQMYQYPESQRQYSSASPEYPIQVPDTAQQKQQNHQQTKVAAEPQIHETSIMIVSDFQALENNVCIAKCLAKGNEFVIYFPYVPDILMKAKEGNYSVKVNLYQQNRKFIFHSLAEAA